MMRAIESFVAGFMGRTHQQVEDSWNDFKNGLREVILRFVPEKMIRERHHLPWINQQIRRLLKKKRRRYIKAKRTGNARHWEEYNQLQKQCRSLIKEAHENYIQGLFESENGRPSKKFWRTVKARRKDNVGVPPLRDCRGSLITDAKGKANVLSEQYKKVFTVEDTGNIPILQTGQHPAMKKILVTRKGVACLLKKLNPNKAIGPDLVSTRILKEYAESLAPALTRIFQQSLDSGQVGKKPMCQPFTKKPANRILLTTDGCHLPVWPANAWNM
jgi:hypothetical protein